jgi:ribosomal protein S18/ribosomal protein S6
MRNYEIVYIFHPALDDEAVQARLERFHALVTGPEGAEVSAVDDWGVRQLAYTIDDQSQGRYVVAQFTAEAGDLPEFERILKLEEELLRYLLVLSEGEPTTGMSILAEVPESVANRENDDDDDDDDDEDEDEEEEEYGGSDGSPPEFSGGRGKRRRVEGPRIELLNYKDVSTLSRFITEQGKILPKRTTKVTARFQRDLGVAVKRARYLALLPYVQNHDR